MRKFFLFYLLILISFVANSQSTVTIKAGAVIAQNTASGPIYRPSNSSNMDYSQYAYLYTAGELNSIPPNTYINSIAWNKTNVGSTTLSGGGKLRIYLKNSTVANYNQTYQLFNNLINGATLLYSNDNTIIPSAPGFVSFPFSAPFLYTGGNLEIIVSWDISGVAGSPTSGSFSWERTQVAKRIYGYATAAPRTGDVLLPAGDSTGDITNTRPVVRFGLSGPAATCTEPPTAGTVRAPDSICIGVNTVLYIDGASNNVQGLSYQWQSSQDGISWTNIGTMSNDSITISQYAPRFYRRITTCASGSEVSDEKFIDVKPFTNSDCVCIPEYRGCFSANYISRVQLGTIDKSSTCSMSSSYTNYCDSTEPPLFYLTSSKFITVDFVAANTGNQYVQAWIDYNHDGVFNDSYYSWTTTASSITGTITIPAYAVPGLTRMRVRYIPSSAILSNPGPCGAIFSGSEAEDYLINIVDANACTGAPANDITVASVPAVCIADSVLLSTTAVNAAATYTYQWQTSTDSSSWQDIQGARATTCVAYQNVNRFYRVRIGCADQYIFTTPVKVEMKTWINCYCKLTRATCGGAEDLIQRVVFGTLNQPSGCSPGGYTDYAGVVPAPPIESGTTVPISVTVGNGLSNYVDVWIDYNMNGDFDSTEHTHIGHSGNSVVLTNNINIPAGISGLTKMRVRERHYYGATNSWDACNFLGGFNDGETEDYLINILAPRHCIPAGTSICSGGDVITRVIFGTIDSTTTCSPGGFGNFTKGLQSDTITANTYVPLSVQAGCGTGIIQTTGVWIDFNQNGEYERNEFTIVGRDCGTAVTNNISIPTNALAGLTNMRIRTTSDTDINPSDACVNYVHGETEEYNIIVNPYTECPTNTWTGLGGDTNWNNAANWSCQQVPGVHSNVVINSGTVEISSNVTVYSLNVNPTATVNVVPPFNLTITH